VRELGNGNSSVTFDYRISALPRTTGKFALPTTLANFREDRMEGCASNRIVGFNFRDHSKTTGPDLICQLVWDRQNLKNRLQPKILSSPLALTFPPN
jgi:hypothetical protein